MDYGQVTEPKNLHGQSIGFVIDLEIFGRAYFHIPSLAGPYLEILRGISLRRVWGWLLVNSCCAIPRDPGHMPLEEQSFGLIGSTSKGWGTLAPRLNSLHSTLRVFNRAGPG